MTLTAAPLPTQPIEYALPVSCYEPVGDRLLPTLCEESKVDRRVWLVIALIVVGLYAVMTLGFWAPGDGGVDQNAYLLGGRMIAEHFSPRYSITSPYQYVGAMMMRTSKLDVPLGDYYPKYPFGLPLLYAIFFWVLGPTKAVTVAFLVSPIGAILAVLGMFFLARLMTGSFAAVLAAMLLGTSQLMIELSNNPNSHASCLAFVVWGMFFLIKWWQTGRAWRGVLAGFLIGYACLIRYSEGLLVLPIAVACVSRLRWTNWRSYLRCAIPGLAWAVPVFAMLIYNKHAMGSWTGYDSTNESEGFTWDKFKTTWEQMIRTYYDMGAFFVLPLGLAGLAIICQKSWKLGAMLLAWLLPGTALYTAYYWSPDRGFSYARFILTFTPVIMLGTAICFSDGILKGMRDRRWYQAIPRVLAAGAVALIACSLGVYRSVHGLQQGQAGNGVTPLFETFRERQNLANIGKVLIDKVPVNAVLFVDNSGGGGGGEKPLNYVQFLRHWDLYATDAFDVGGPRRGGPPMGGMLNAALGFGNNANPAADANAQPNPRQQLEVEYLDKVYAKKTSNDLRKDETAIIDAANQTKVGAYVLLPVTRDTEIRRELRLLGKQKLTVVSTWTDLQPGPPDPVAENISNNGMGGRRGRPRPPNAGGGGNGRRGGGGGGPGGVSNAEPAAISWELLKVQ